MAALLLIASKWKSDGVLTREEWLAKMRHLALTAKLTAGIRYRQGNLRAVELYKQQWACFFQIYCTRKSDYSSLHTMLEL